MSTKDLQKLARLAVDATTEVETLEELKSSLHGSNVHMLTTPSVTITDDAAPHRLVVSFLRFSASDTTQTYYHKQARGYALRKGPLMQLAHAAGLSFPNPPQVTRHSDGSMTVANTGYVQVSPGNWKAISAAYTHDLTAIREDLEAKGSSNTDKIMAAERRYATMKADTGCLERIVRAALGIKQIYDEAELDQPFVVARIDWKTSANTAQAIAQSILARKALADLSGDLTDDPTPQEVAMAQHIAMASGHLDDPALLQPPEEAPYDEQEPF